MLKLVIEDGEGTTHVVPIIRDQITIGREEGNTIRLTERNVSRHHARLTRSSGDGDSTIIVEDLDSYNGVKVNGMQVIRKQTLVPEDTMQIGDYFIAIESDVKSKPVASLIDTTVTEMESTEELNPSLERELQGRLVVVSSNLAGEVFWLSRRQMLVGRSVSEGNDLVVKHRSISRHHAKFIYREGAYTLVDLASSNGVLVNGVEAGTTSLVNGDIIEMGHVKLRYCAPGDDYTFQMTDIDDVLVVSAGQSLRLLLTVLVLLGIAAAAFMITNNETSKSDSLNLSKRAIPQNDTPSSADKTATTLMNEVTTDKSAPVKSNGEESTKLILSKSQRALFEEAATWTSKKEWSVASRVYDKILEDQTIAASGIQTKALKLKSMVDLEATNLRRLERLQEIELGEDKSAILKAPLPTVQSVYFEDAKATRGRVVRAKLAELEDQFRINMDAKSWSDAEEDVSNMVAFGLSRAQVETYQKSIRERRDAARKQRKKKNKEKRVKKSTKRPEREKTNLSVSASDSPKTNERQKQPKIEVPSAAKKPLSSTAQKQIATLRILENAYRINPNDKATIKKLCDLSNATGNVKKAIKYCAKRLKSETNKHNKKAIERKMERWKKTAP